MNVRQIVEVRIKRLEFKNSQAGRLKWMSLLYTHLLHILFATGSE